MAIERTEINGDFSALKTALETLVPAFFASVELTDASTITCKDADENTLLVFAVSGNTHLPRAYRSADNYLTPITAGMSYLGAIKYFFKVGANGAFLTYPNGDALAIAKAENGKTAIVMPGNGGSAVENRLVTLLAACWGDDTAYSNPLWFAAASTTNAVSNNCLFVPVPLYGNYQTPNNVPKVFFMPVAQANMRGIVQEVTSDSGTYVTNGYLAMLYDAGGEA